MLRSVFALFVATCGASVSVVRADVGSSGNTPPLTKETLRWQRTDSSLSLMQGQQTVWRFTYDPAFGKAHFDPLGPVGAPSLTWSKPPDHVWHYGLWFSWKYLNGVNYWEEDKKTQRAKGRTTATRVNCTPRDDHSARIEMELRYHLPGMPPGEAVLTEKRTIEVSAPQRDGQYHIDWTATFQAGAADVRLDRTPLPNEPGGRAYGGYAGLSLRMRNLQERQAVATTGPVTFSAQNRYRGKATALDYNGKLHGQTVGVAICDHPKNLNSPTPWYVIRSRVMTFFTPAVICFRPHTLKARARFDLRYRVIVHKGRWSEKQLKSAYDAFVKASKNGGGAAGP